jgi:hypothetical protein
MALIVHKPASRRLISLPLFSTKPPANITSFHTYNQTWRSWSESLVSINPLYYNPEVATPWSFKRLAEVITLICSPLNSFTHHTFYVSCFFVATVLDIQILMPSI